LQTASAKQTSSPSDFPKVDGGTQKARDSDRRQILQDEMKSEEQKLTSIKKEFNNGEPERQGDERNYAKYQERVANLKENLDRTEKNIEALKREIGNTR
jgi:predicted RNase H-like nuclease (RuvC/YqgF family)